MGSGFGRHARGGISGLDNPSYQKSRHRRMKAADFLLHNFARPQPPEMQTRACSAQHEIAAVTPAEVSD